MPVADVHAMGDPESLDLQHMSNTAALRHLLERFWVVRLVCSLKNAVLPMLCARDYTSGACG